MLQDSFQKQKIEKHINYIPSREFILKHLVKRRKPASYKEIATELNINKDKEKTRALRRRLRAMERDGQLVFTHNQNYAIPEHLNFLRGMVIGHRYGYGFLRVKERKDDLYLSPTQMKYCIHGDQVLAQPLRMDRKGRYEARIIRILVPRTNKIIGRYFINANMRFVIPNDSRLNFNILIPPEEVMNAKMGFIVLVELTQRPAHHNRAIGKIIEVLGANMNTNIAIDIALRTHEIPYIWPKVVREEIKNLREEIPEEVKTSRIDIRNLPLITIDSEDANDFDDAVYCEKNGNDGWKLLVVIADVSYYVRPYTSIDNEARNRGTSIYFPSQVIPMLPEILSNKLCSLNPQVDRLCMVCEMTISSEGKLTHYKFYEAIMNSRARLTYTKVWHILQGDLELCRKYTPLLQHIRELYNLYKVLTLAREKRGSISFESEDIRFILNSKYRVKHIEKIYRNDAHKLIEECMILANISAAHFVEKTKEPILFRVHDKPTDEAITIFRSMLAELNLKLPGGNQPKPHDYAKLLNFIANRPDACILQTMLLRSMKQAIYDLENRGHFGLALQSYAHFTSPIRRYPDLSLHRVIKYLIAHEHGFKGSSTRTGGYHYSTEEVFQLGQHCSMVERRADNVVREITDWLKCDFMLKQIGNTFNGIIANVTNFGFFVHLNELFIDGLVHISSLKNDYYYFDQIKQCLVGEYSGQIYRIGDHVKIRLEAVNMDERKIDFVLASGENNTRYII